MIITEEPELKIDRQSLPKQGPPVSLKKEPIHIAENDMLSHQPSLMSSSTISLAPCYSHNEHTYFCCLFCLKRFDTQQKWAEHEKSRHFLAQRFWTCMPRGPVEYADDGNEVCVFCLAADPDAGNCAQHNYRRCFRKNQEDRTYRCRQDFEYHLRIVHGQDTLNEWIKNWLSPPADDLWYWFCGFCGEVMITWTQQVGHFSEHFRKGVSISSWDLLIPSSPIDKNTGAPIT